MSQHLNEKRRITAYGDAMLPFGQHDSAMTKNSNAIERTSFGGSMQMSTERELIAESVGAPDRPRLIFFTELGGEELLALLRRPGLLDLLRAEHYEVALSVARLDEARAQAARLLNASGIPLIAWLVLPPEA